MMKNKISFTSHCRNFLGAAFILAMGLLGVELYFRLAVKFGSASRHDYLNSFMWKAQLQAMPRMHGLWGRVRNEQEGMFFPPHVVYLNTGFDDPARMQAIAKATRFPANRKWDTPNFLRNEREYPSTIFHVSTNSLGFRGREYPIRKPKGTYRIIVLGSYPAFGHGVNDEETYPAFVEKILNSKNLKNFKFEVWNGGRQGSTAIMGLSRLDAEISNYDPDLLLWDYGWVELFTRSEREPTGKVAARLFKFSPIGISIDYFCKVGSGIFYKSQVCNHVERKRMKWRTKTFVEGFREANKRMIRWAAEKNIPVLLVRHSGTAMPVEEFQAFEDVQNGIYFVDTSAAIDAAKISEAEKNEFWAKPTWLDEIEVTRAMVGDNPHVYCRGDAILYNARGYSRIAELIEKNIEKIFISAKPQ